VLQTLEEEMKPLVAESPYKKIRIENLQICDFCELVIEKKNGRFPRTLTCVYCSRKCHMQCANPHIKSKHAIRNDEGYQCPECVKQNVIEESETK